MRLFEFTEQDLSTGYYDPAEDKVNQRRPNQIRKPIIKLSDLNKLKRMKALHKLDVLKRQDLLSVMYGDASGDGEGGEGGGDFGGF